MKKNKFKLGSLLIILTTLFILTSCKPDFSIYSGLYEMSNYDVLGDPVSFELIDIYTIELTDKGIANHTLKIGVMEKVEKFSNYYDVDEKKAEITFFIKQGILVSNAEVWKFENEQIIMENLYIPIIKDPNSSNESHYRLVNIYFTKKQ